MTPQEKSRANGRSIDPNADPLHVRCGGSGWYMVGMGGDFETCDCTVVRHYGLRRAHVPNSPMIKEANFFADQGGLTDDWGKAWEPIRGCRTIGEARRKFSASYGATLSPIYHGEP